MKKSLTKLTIKNFEIYAFHGVREEEAKLGGKFQIDVEIWYDATEASVQDDISKALNYENILFDISEICSNENYQLIETLNLELLKTLVENYINIEKVTVRVRKFNIPFKGILDYVESEQTFEN
ncbi:MAG: dihydroneopterin aldolase [Ignavibacteria bacterium GWF2_33_9]|nr:MAG: dihydroneopterin aldolase [Ignavibacteria bacterium GWF2_33_9]